jgi:hypothetical protein
MLGPPEARRLDGPVTALLENLVPQNDFCRHLEAKLDLDFVRDWLREQYAEQGRSSIDPSSSPEEQSLGAPCNFPCQ